MSLGIARPELLPVVLAPVLIGALLAVALARRRRALAAFGGAGSALVSASPVRQLTKLALLVVALLAIAVALVGPQIGEAPRKAAERAADVVIALDVSQSMAVRDVAPDRLRSAQHAIEVLGQQLAGSRVGLILFAGGSVQRYPLTTDTKVLGPALDTSGRGFRINPGSSLRAALTAGQALFPASPLDDRRAKALVLITDGEDPAAQLPPLDTLRQRNIHVFALGVGTVEGGTIPVYDTKGQFIQNLRTPTGEELTSHLDEQRLRELTDLGGGRYWHLEGDATARALADTLRSLDPGTAPTESGGVSPDDRYQVFLAIGIAALLAEWLIDERRKMPRPLVGAGRAVRGRRGAATVTTAALFLMVACGGDPLVGQVDEANAMFARGDVRGALTRYRDLQLQRPGIPELAVNAGNALQELGDVARSLTSYQQALDGAKGKTRAAAYYDRGNALFHLGRLADARAAYVEALKVDPTDRDAKFNVEVIDRLFAQLEPAQQQGTPQPGQSQQPGPGQSPQTGGQNPQQGTPQQGGQPQGSPPNDGRPGPPAPPSVNQALTDFRKDLTPEEAMRLLDALRGEQRGVEGLIEGQGTRRGNNVDVPY